MSRSDWTGTIPTAPAQLTANETLAASLAFTQYDGSEANSVEMPTLGAKNGLTLASMIGKDFDDPECRRIGILRFASCLHSKFYSPQSNIGR